MRVLGKAKAVLCRSPILAPWLRKISFVLNPILQNKFDLIRKKNIDLILDVGAHIGEYGVDLRYYGYQNKIISFEPIKDAFIQLQRKAKKYDRWECYNYALGDKERTQNINVLNNRSCSSFLKASDFFVEKYGHSTEKIREELVEIKKLDQIFHKFYNPTNRVLLKLDVQGFEKQILDGAENSLPYISLVQLETSMVSLYENELTIARMIDYMESKDFIPGCIEPHLTQTASIQQLQADILFIKRQDHSNL